MQLQDGLNSKKTSYNALLLKFKWPKTCLPFLTFKMRTLNHLFPSVEFNCFLPKKSNKLKFCHWLKPTVALKMVIYTINIMVKDI